MQYICDNYTCHSNSLKMHAPSTNGVAYDTTFNHITVKKLHPTFGAEISGVDFSAPLPDDVFFDILAAITKVCLSLPFPFA